MLELIDIHKHYPSPATAEPTPVLAGITLTVEPGASLAIIGPSGTGKSTLLNIIGALDRPTTGRVIIDGRDLTDLTDPQLARLRNQQIGFVFQLHHLLPQCSVLENVLLPTLAAPTKPPAAPTEQRARDLLDRVGLTDQLHHRPGQLSAGQRQRTALVRALINRPKLLLADEPTGSLDAVSADTIADLLVDLNRSENTTLIVVTHSARLARRLDRVLQLDQGRLTPTETAS